MNASQRRRFGSLTFCEIRECVEASWLAVLPTGCTEQQGPHLPVDFDSWLAETLCLAATEEAAQSYNVQALVLPVIPFGPTPEHRNYGSGYIDVPQQTHAALVDAVLESLASQGFTRIVIWRGCGQHNLGRVVREFNEARPGKARAFQVDPPFHRIWCEVGDPAVSGGHADSLATSLALFLRPDCVRRDRIACPDQNPVDWDDPDLDFARYSTSGVIGDPTHASAERGERLWQALVAETAIVLRDIAVSDPTSDCR